MSEKDQLVPQSAAQKDPHQARPEDFTVGGGKRESEAGGKNELSRGVTSARHIQDGGPGPHGSGTPSEWGKEAGVGAIGRNSVGTGTSVSIPEGVDLTTGKITGGTPTRVGEVFDSKVKIPSRK